MRKTRAEIPALFDFCELVASYVYLQIFYLPANEGVSSPVILIDNLASKVFSAVFSPGRERSDSRVCLTQG
jgi:hypothetical protein